MLIVSLFQYKTFHALKKYYFLVYNITQTVVNNYFFPANWSDFFHSTQQIWWVSPSFLNDFVFASTFSGLLFSPTLQTKFSAISLQQVCSDLNLLRLLKKNFFQFLFHRLKSHTVENFTNEISQEDLDFLRNYTVS